jgi:hypothetical protein
MPRTNLRDKPDLDKPGFVETMAEVMMYVVPH